MLRQPTFHFPELDLWFNRQQALHPQTEGKFLGIVSTLHLQGTAGIITLLIFCWTQCPKVVLQLYFQPSLPFTGFRGLSGTGNR